MHPDAPSWSQQLAALADLPSHTRTRLRKLEKSPLETNTSRVALASITLLPLLG